MPVANRLKALKVKSFPPGKCGDGNGLWLLKRPNGGGQWPYRYSLYGRRKELGMGSLREVTLRDARIAAEEVRRDLREGRDPRKQRQIRLGHLRRVSDTLEAIAQDAYESHRKTLKNVDAETTDCPNDVAEAMLAHETGSDVERAYRRTDFLEKRRGWTDAWAAFIIAFEADIAKAA